MQAIVDAMGEKRNDLEWICCIGIDLFMDEYFSWIGSCATTGYKWGACYAGPALAAVSCAHQRFAVSTPAAISDPMYYANLGAMSCMAIGMCAVGGGAVGAAAGVGVVAGRGVKEVAVAGYRGIKLVGTAISSNCRRCFSAKKAHVQ